VLKGHIELPSGWEDILADALEEERPVLVGLADAGLIIPPELGLESTSGYVLSLGWTDQKVGVLIEEDLETQTALESEGWTILGPDVKAIMSALQNNDYVVDGGANSGADVSPAWKSLLEEALEDERALIAELAAAGMTTLPTLGAEIGDGYPMMLVWEERRIAVSYLDEETPDGLLSEGWTIVEPDARLILESLKEKGIK